MDPLIEEVHNLDQVARSISRNPEEKVVFENCLLREDAFALMEAIFQNAEEEQTLFTGAHILRDFITKKWETLNQSQQLDLRFFVLNLLETLPSKLRVYQQVCDALVQIAIRDFPQNWPNFLQQIFSSEPPKFKLFADFTAALKDSKSSSEHLQQISDNILQHTQIILPIIISHFPHVNSNDALIELVPYLNWEILHSCNIQILYENPHPLGFQALCELLLVPGIDADCLRTFFVALANTESDENYNYLLPVIQQYLEDLENENSIECLTQIHEKLLEDILDYEYWEFFILTIYDDFINGNPERFNIHEGIIGILINHLLTKMPHPDVITAGSSSNYSNKLLVFEQMQAMCIAIIEMAPDAFVTAISDLFQSQLESFDITTFSSLCCATACVAFEECIDENFAAEVFRLACEAVEATSESQESLACLLYLTLSLTKVEKITGEVFDVAAQFTINTIGKSDVEKLAMQAIHALSYASDEFGRYIDPPNLLLFEETSMNSDNFAVMADAVCHVTPESQRQNLIAILVNRITSAYESGISFPSIREIRFCVAGLAGTARADKNCVIQAMSTLTPILSELNGRFLNDIMTLISENGDNAARDDIRLMRSFFCSEMQLYVETSPQAGAVLLQIFAQLPPKLRMPDAVNLARSMVAADSSLIGQVREMVLGVIQSEVGEGKISLDYAISLPELLQTVAMTDISSILSVDIESLEILISKQVNKQTLLALTEIINRWTSHPDRQNLMREHLARIVVCVICAACEPSHRFAFVEFSKIARHLIMFAVNPECEVSLYDGLDNAVFLGQFVANELRSRFPVIPAHDIESLCTLLIEQASSENFDQVVIQTASKAKMATDTEIVRHLRVLRVKSAMGMGLFD